MNTRWYLRHEPKWPGFAVVVEETSSPHRGVVCYVRGRREARVCLPGMRDELARRIAQLDRPTKTFDPEET